MLKKKMVAMVAASVLALSLAVGATYAWFTSEAKIEAPATIEAGRLTITAELDGLAYTDFDGTELGKNNDGEYIKGLLYPTEVIEGVPEIRAYGTVTLSNESLIPAIVQFDVANYVPTVNLFTFYKNDEGEYVKAAAGVYDPSKLGTLENPVKVKVGNITPNTIETVVIDGVLYGNVPANTTITADVVVYIDGIANWKLKGAEIDYDNNTLQGAEIELGDAVFLGVQAKELAAQQVFDITDDADKAELHKLFD